MSKGKNLPEDKYKRGHVSAFIDKDKAVIHAQQSQSIIPDPQFMEGYKNIDPEFPNMIMQWTEDNLRHQRKIQSRALNFMFFEAIANNLFGLIVVGMLCATGLLFAHWESPRLGASIICSTVVATASIFVLKKMGKLPNTTEDVK